MKTKDINEAIQWWRDVYEEQADYELRRYPPCIDHLNGVVSIADEDDNGTNLTMCDAETFAKWIQKAKNFMEAHQGDGCGYEKMDALFETQPETVSYLSH